MHSTVNPLRALLLSTTLLSASVASTLANAAEWQGALQSRVERIDKETPGTIGVYVKRLDTGDTMSYQADRRWYLSSTVKVPIALAVLQDVEAGKLSLNREVRLADTDKIDGSGPTVWRDAGSSFSIDTLVKEMLMKSDNSAANMLVRSVGEDRVNDYAKRYLGAGNVGRLTDFAEIRYAVYAEMNPAARKLPNIDLVKAAAAPVGPRRTEALQRLLPEGQPTFATDAMEQAYARYYASGVNSASLSGYGDMLEQLVRGRLVSTAHKDLMFKYMKFDTYDAYRLEAGLPRSVRFIHKTGTQFERACHMGVIEPQDMGKRAIVVATCAEGLDEDKEAGAIFLALGQAITQTMLKDAGAVADARSQPVVARPR